jgi:hypothetical protein
MQRPLDMPTHLDLPGRNPPEKDDWNARTWIFPTLVGLFVLAFALVYYFVVR